MKNPVIAVAPIKYFDINKTNNIFKIVNFIRKAKRKKADIICFPESCIKKIGALDMNDRLIKLIQDECKRNKIWAIITENVRMNEGTFNVSMLVDRQGKIKGRYKKINLSGDDKIVPGNKVRVFKTDFAKIGIAICWDLAFPELFEKMGDMGAEIVFCPARWAYEESVYQNMHKKRETELLRALVLSRAFENLYYVVLCNPLRDDKEQISYSVIASPHRILKEIKDKEGIITAKLDLKEIRKLRKLYAK